MGRTGCPPSTTPGRRVVGDRIGDADTPVGDAAVDDFQCRQHEVHCSHGLGDCHTRTGEVALHDQGDLRLDTRLQEGGHCDGIGLRVEHLVVQDTEIRLTHPI